MTKRLRDFDTPTPGCSGDSGEVTSFTKTVCIATVLFFMNDAAVFANLIAQCLAHIYQLPLYEAKLECNVVSCILCDARAYEAMHSSASKNVQVFQWEKEIPSWFLDILQAKIAKDDKTLAVFARYLIPELYSKRAENFSWFFFCDVNDMVTKEGAIAMIQRAKSTVVILIDFNLGDLLGQRRCRYLGGGLCLPENMIDAFREEVMNMMCILQEIADSKKCAGNIRLITNTIVKYLVKDYKFDEYHARRLTDQGLLEIMLQRLGQHERIEVKYSEGAKGECETWFSNDETCCCSDEQCCNCKDSEPCGIVYLAAIFP